MNAVAPGIIKTPMHSVEEYAQLATLHPVGRLGEISDIVDAILYLEGASFRDRRNPSRPAVDAERLLCDGKEDRRRNTSERAERRRFRSLAHART